MTVAGCRRNISNISTAITTSISPTMSMRSTCRSFPSCCPRLGRGSMRGGHGLGGEGLAEGIGVEVADVDQVGTGAGGEHLRRGDLAAPGAELPSQIAEVRVLERAVVAEHRAPDTVGGGTLPPENLESSSTRGHEALPVRAAARASALRSRRRAGPWHRLDALPGDNSGRNM